MVPNKLSNAFETNDVEKKHVVSRLLITTVGTSLLTNRDDRPWTGWNGRAGNPLPQAAEVDRWLEAADPILASAETNTLRSIEITAADHVLLLSSDTPEGCFCSDRLHRFYMDIFKCRRVEARPLIALGYAGANFTQNGLKVLVHEAITAVKEARSESLDPVFCATGGFKAEIAFLNLLGALLLIEVIYIHERFREVVRLPRLPLTWDTNWFLERQQFFEWIQAELRPSAEVTSRVKADPELQTLIENNSEGFSFLNAAGELLFTAAGAIGPRAVWPSAVPLPPGEKNGLSGIPHHRPKGWETFVGRLCKIDCVSQVSYDSAAFGGAPAKVLCATKGTISVRWGPADCELPLRVETTAQGAAQTELVRVYIENKFL